MKSTMSWRILTGLPVLCRRAACKRVFGKGNSQCVSHGRVRRGQWTRSYRRRSPPAGIVGRMVNQRLSSLSGPSPAELRPLRRPDGARPRVLFAEDSENARVLTAALLTWMGCDVDAVEDGEQALNQACRS